MLNKFRCFSLSVILVSLIWQPLTGHAASGGATHAAGKLLNAAVRAVITRTIVIDHAPFPDVAGNVHTALIKDGETIVLEQGDTREPCSPAELQVSASSDAARKKAPEVSISSAKAVLCEGETGTLTAKGASTYSWSTGEESTSIQITPAATTQYFVIGANKQGCKTIATFIQQVAGCQGPATNGDHLHIFPNPSTGHFYVKVQSSGANLSLQVFNHFGKLVREQKIETEALQIDLSGEPDGIYLLRLIELGKEIQRKRLYKAQ